MYPGAGRDLKYGVDLSTCNTMLPSTGLENKVHFHTETGLRNKTRLQFVGLRVHLRDLRSYVMLQSICKGLTRIRSEMEYLKLYYG